MIPITISIPSMNPPSALSKRRRRRAEASLRGQQNRERSARYPEYRCRYTSGRSGMPIDAPARQRVADAYDAHYDVLRFVAAQKFRIPDPDVRPLIHDVFIAYMRHASVIGDDRSWLVAALINACRNYWRDRKPSEPVPDVLADPRALADDVSAKLDVARVLRRLPKRCRAVLWLRYVDGCAPAEIAHRCATSSSAPYGRKLVHQCLRAAREAVANLKAGRT
jgi:RNA polymerase sigma factor (sigma-70 family)